ncbi:MAG TPA: hypothetical protein VKE40_18635 [Gemmataceae bacterium]|nr:hypothetical protein [Gemmataceae bacterium]
MRLTQLAAGLFALIILAPAWAKDEKVSIRGTPASVSPADEEGKKSGILGTILIEGKKDKDTEYDKAMVKVTKATKIFQLVGKDLKPASFDDLKPGVKMEIEFSGPPDASFPPNATAGKIVIHPR